MADFVEYPQDEFRPEYGGINWIHRLNALLESSGVEITPVGYTEGSEPMQINQENCVIYINQVADEMDCVAVNYHLDEKDVYTWYFREKFASPEMFAHVIGVVGAWATQVITLYPMKHVVEQYEAFQATDLDHVPDDWA